MADIFLSYARADRERIRSLVKILEERGWSVWWDRKIPKGKPFHQVIQQAIDEAKCVVVIWSQQSIKSNWVISEAGEGLDRQVLIPVLIDKVKAPLPFGELQEALLDDWNGESSHHELEALIDAIKAITGEPAIIKPDIHHEASPKEPTESSRRIFATALDSFEFDVVTVDAKGNVTARTKKSANHFIEDLGSGVALEMVEIPGGIFTMGSPWDEAGHRENEDPQRQVMVKPFFIGKYQVTRAQWRAIAGDKLLKVARDLDPDPSEFKDDWRQPIEHVSWADAVEFCRRLEKKTGKQYRLPSEAEWEYAARAGTTTPFAFGPTITWEIVNFDSNNPFGSAAKVKYRRKTIPVGALGVANAFGLFDMHGNVWEWCEDVWHDNYEGAPSDGSAWVSGSNKDHDLMGNKKILPLVAANKVIDWMIGGNEGRHVLRGGSWFDLRDSCRSAYRHFNERDLLYTYTGFRVVYGATANWSTME
jgi:formylglycine-generating enzyme required for sulfatase activity